MPVFKLLYSFCGRIRIAKGRSATPDAEAPQKTDTNPRFAVSFPNCPALPRGRPLAH